MIADQLLDQTPPPAPQRVDSPEARINFLFRTTQRQGRIHPLLHLLQQHRAAQADTATKEPQ